MGAVEEASGFSLRQQIAVLALGVGAGVIPALQPILMNGLLVGGLLNAAQIGHAATAEALGMATSVTLAAIFLQPRRLREIVTVSVIVILLANVFTGFAHGAQIVALRGIGGFFSGLLLWNLIGLLTRATNPGRLFAIYVTAQATVAFAMSAAFTQAILPTFGAIGGYLTLSIINGILLIAAAFAPQAYRQIGNATVSRPPLSGLVALLGLGLFLSGIMAFWVYVIPLLRQVSSHSDQAADAVFMAIGFQIAGGIAAALGAGRLPAALVCTLGPVIATACMVGVIYLDSSIAMIASLMLFSFIWMFVPPFQLPLLLEIDPSLRTAMFISSSQLIGVAGGPLLASLTITDTDMLGAVKVSVICFALAVVLPILALAMRKRELQSSSVA